MPTLNAFLVPKDNGAESDFGEGDGYFVGLEVVKFLKGAITGVRAFDNADFWWSRTRGSVGQRDLVCYVFDEIGQSIVIKHSKTKTLQSEVGNTVWSPQAQRMISEVYIAGAMKYAADPQQRNRVLAIAIVHEFMHNKLDLYPYTKGAAGYVKDIHTSTGKAARHGITYTGGFYDAEDVKLMSAGIMHQIPQYTAEM
jgi:hypothetical protein